MQLVEVQLYKLALLYSNLNKNLNNIVIRKQNKYKSGGS